MKPDLISLAGKKIMVPVPPLPRGGTVEKYHRLSAWSVYARSLWGGFWSCSAFRSVKAFCLFLGSSRTGHSLIGSLLDAHPGIMMAHEADCLQYVESGFSRDQIFYLIRKNSETFGAAGRRWTGYDYGVAGGSQGRSSRIRVLGDKKGLQTTLRLARDPDLLDHLVKTVRLPLKVFHIVRNPYDVIARRFLATIARGSSGVSLSEMAQDFFRVCDAVESLKKKVNLNDLFEVPIERFIEDPKNTLKAMVSFLGLEAGEDYLDRCAGIVFQTPNQTRDRVVWDPLLARGIREKFGNYSFLEEYLLDERPERVSCFSS